MRVPLPFSALVPVHNEAPILADTLTRMVDGLRTLGAPFEIDVCENGSTDGSLAEAQALQAAHPEIRVHHSAVADYGLALRHGTAVARHDAIVVYNLDFWSLDFTRDALAALRTADVVIGSKAMAGARDHRPLLRRWITRGFNGGLRLVFGFRGTDTHGMKAMRRSAVLPILGACVTTSWMLDTELVLRAERRGLTVVEIPVEIREVRARGYGAILARVPRVLRSLVTLWRALRHAPRTHAGHAAAGPLHTDVPPNPPAEAPLLRHDRGSV